MKKDIKYLIESIFDDPDITGIEETPYDLAVDDIELDYRWIPEFLYENICKIITVSGSYMVTDIIVNILKKVKPEMLKNIPYGSFNVLEHFGNNAYRFSSHYGNVAFKDFLYKIYMLFNGHYLDLNWIDVSGMTELSYTFQDWGGVDTKKVSTSFSKTSDEEPIRTIIDISAWDVKSVKKMEGIFKNTNIIIKAEGWELDACTSLREAFYKAKHIDKSIGTWKFKKLDNLSSTFAFAENIKADISKWDTSKVVYLYHTFEKVALLDDFAACIGNMDVSSVIDFQNCFEQAKGWCDLSKWDVHNGKRFNFMFYNADIYDANINDWDVSNAVDIDNMFNFSSYQGDISSWKNKLHKKTILNCDPKTQSRL